MCQRLYAYCKGCQTFYPSKRRVRVKKVRCAQHPQCKATSFLLDVRHEGCKPKEKGFLAGMFGKKDDKKEQIPLDEKTSAKVAKLDEHRLKKKQKREQSGLKAAQNVQAHHGPFEDICSAIDSEISQQGHSKRNSFGLANEILDTYRISLSSEYESDVSCRNFVSEPGLNGLKSCFWTPKNIGDEYRNLLDKREF